MKKAILVHNPTSGDGKHSKKELKERIEELGYKVKYYSTNRFFWKHFTSKKADMVFIAGGDGTVQKVAKAILEKGREKIMNTPITVLPCGTANNIATTLKIGSTQQGLEDHLQKTGFDIGSIEGAKEASFFIEGMGCGIFPKLVRVMSAKDEDEKQNEIQKSLRELLKVIDTYEAQEAIIIADKEEVTGKFLLVELLNIKYIGPNIELAPGAQTGDGSFELVTVQEDSRQELKDFITGLLNGKKPIPIEKYANLKKVKEVRLKWAGGDVHIDDEIVESYKGQELVIKNRQAMFNFMTT